MRACIWVQGCPIRCRGCAVPWTWPEEGGHDIEVAELAAAILNGPEVEGITFLGGEPFAQAEACAELAGMVRQRGLSVMTLTGYVLEEIESGDPGGVALLEATDLLIDGPFVLELADLGRPWVGSSNQRYHFLTARYADLKGKLETIPNRVEVSIATDGTVQVNGMYDPREVAELLRSMGLEPPDDPRMSPVINPQGSAPA